MTNTEPATARQTAYATELRDNLRAVFAANDGVENPLWKGEFDRRVDETAFALRQISRNKREREQLAPAWAALITEPMLDRNLDRAGARALRAETETAVRALRMAVIDTTDEQIAAMTKTQASDFIDRAKGV